MKRKYPVGIQSFETIREDGYVYVDKTPLIYKMITEGKPYFLSRPRRFGKSLLVSTLQAVFEGRRELFEAFTTAQGIEQPQLYIARSDWQWEQYPVLRFDFSAGDLATIGQLDTLIDATLAGYEQEYGIKPTTKEANIRMINLLRTLHEQTGKRVVVLVDEYDNFILHALGDEAKVALARQRFQNLFGPLKAEDDHLQFAFITGISKFSQMGIFSKLNNLYNISMVPAYEELCGISEAELTMQLRPDIEQLAQQNGLSFDEQLQELKRMYDGYHFCERLTDIYNPFSLIKAFYSGQVKKYWFESGTSAALIAMLQQMPPLELQDVDGAVCESDAFDESFDSYQAPLPVLYQSGYLTIKDYSREDDTYTLGFPNQEVRTGFASSLYRAVTNTMSDDHGRTAMMRAYKNFKRDDALPPFIEAIKTFYAGVPYQWERDNRNEHYYHAMLYTLLTAFGADLRAEEATAKGRSDITLLMPRGIYVMELKYDDTAQAALAQIAAKGYAEKYRQDGRPVVLVGISFSSKEHNIDDWLAKRL